MKVMFYSPPTSGMQGWLADIANALPEAECRFWQEGDSAHADYAVVWQPPAAMLQGRTALKRLVLPINEPTKESTEPTIKHKKY